MSEQVIQAKRELKELERKWFNLTTKEQPEWMHPTLEKDIKYIEKEIAKRKKIIEQ